MTYAVLSGGHTGVCIVRRSLFVVSCSLCFTRGNAMEEKTKKTNKRFKLFLIIFILLGFIFMKKENQQKFISFFDSVNSKGKKTIIFNNNFDCEDEEKILFFNNSIIKWKDNNISFLDLKGNNIWNKEFDFSQPDILVFEKYIYVVDKESGNIYVLDNKGNTVYRLELNTHIFNMSESEDNILVHIKTDDIEEIRILDKEGKELVKKEQEYILTYSIDNKKSKFILSSLNLEKGLKSYANVYSFTNDSLGSFKFDDEIILFTQFINNKILIATDKSLYLVENNDTIWSHEYPLIKDILINKEKIYLLYGDNLEIIDLNGETEKKITFGIEYKRIVQLQNYICLYGQKDILILNNGEEIINYMTDNDIVDIKGNNKLIAIHYLDGLEIYDIIDKE